MAHLGHLSQWCSQCFTWQTLNVEVGDCPLAPLITFFLFELSFSLFLCSMACSKKQDSFPLVAYSAVVYRKLPPRARCTYTFRELQKFPPGSGFILPCHFLLCSPPWQAYLQHSWHAFEQEFQRLRSLAKNVSNICCLHLAPRISNLGIIKLIYKALGLSRLSLLIWPLHLVNALILRQTNGVWSVVIFSLVGPEIPFPENRSLFSALAFLPFRIQMEP